MNGKPDKQTDTTWNTNLLVGVEVVDRDHQDLITGCDQLIHMAEQPLSRSDLTVAISELLASIEVHFICEEERFPHQYRHRDHHLKEHDTLRTMLGSLLCQSQHQQLAQSVRTVRLLFIDHIRRFDCQVWHPPMAETGS